MLSQWETHLPNRVFLPFQRPWYSINITPYDAVNIYFLTPWLQYLIPWLATNPKFYELWHLPNGCPWKPPTGRQFDTFVEDILPLTISCLMTSQEPINSNCTKIGRGRKVSVFCKQCPQSLIHVWLFATPRTATPRTATHQASLSKECFRQEHWSRLPFPPPGDLLNPGIKPESLVSPTLAGRSFTTEPPGKPPD